jgi:hypothetical protein
VQAKSTLRRTRELRAPPSHPELGCQILGIPLQDQGQTYPTCPPTLQQGRTPTSRTNRTQSGQPRGGTFFAKLRIKKIPPKPRGPAEGARSVLPTRPSFPRRHPAKPSRSSTGEGACHQMPGVSRCPVPLVPAGVAAALCAHGGEAIEFASTISVDSATDVHPKAGSGPQPSRLVPSLYSCGCASVGPGTTCIRGG